jgi:hypothetical protein
MIGGLALKDANVRLRSDRFEMLNGNTLNK